jgi:quercetin dioxygenase-like cupin family protein
MRSLLKALVVTCLLALALPIMVQDKGLAQDEGPPVPVQKAAYHWPIFSNEYIMMLRVYMRTGKGSNFHTHSLDQISILVEAGANEGQVYGKTEKIAAKAGTRGSVGFTPFSKKSFTHRSTNTATTPFDNLVIALLKPGPGSFTPQARDVPGYRQLFDNDRVRAWRLQLEPGQTTGPITQTAPGLRVIIDGDELQEIIKGETDRPLALRSGDFYWQEPGVTRAIRNSGSTAINLVEFELK